MYWLQKRRKETRASKWHRRGRIIRVGWKHGARASASRLVRHPHIRAATQWLYAQVAHEIPNKEPMPTTAIGIWLRLTRARKPKGRVNQYYCDAVVRSKLLFELSSL
jgi:hypothetical protein